MNWTHQFKLNQLASSFQIELISLIILILILIVSPLRFTALERLTVFELKERQRRIEEEEEAARQIALEEERQRQREREERERQEAEAAREREERRSATEELRQSTGKEWGIGILRREGFCGGHWKVGWSHLNSELIRGTTREYCTGGLTTRRYEYGILGTHVYFPAIKSPLLIEHPIPDDMRPRAELELELSLTTPDTSVTSSPRSPPLTPSTPSSHLTTPEKGSGVKKKASSLRLTPTFARKKLLSASKSLGRNKAMKSLSLLPIKLNLLVIRLFNATGHTLKFMIVCIQFEL